MNAPDSEEWGARDSLYEGHAGYWLRLIEEATDETPEVTTRPYEPRHRRREWKLMLRFRLQSGLVIKVTVPGRSFYAWREMDRELEDWKNCVLARRSK